MIRKFRIADLDDVMLIWLSSNIEAHDFIPKEYWFKSFAAVKSMIPHAEIYVCEQANRVVGFVGINEGTIEGIFVTPQSQSHGVGKMLINECKNLYESLILKVYEKNKRAIAFYAKHGFTVQEKQLDSLTNEKEYLLIWNCERAHNIFPLNNIYAEQR